MSDNATTKETSKLLTDASNRLAQWDLWETDYYDKSNRRHNSAKDMVTGLREEISKKTEDQSIEDIEYFLGMCETAFRSAPNASNNEPPIMNRGKSVVTPRVKGISMEIEKYAIEAIEYMLAKFPGMLHLYRTSWSDSETTGGESYAVAGKTATDLAEHEASSLADKATSQPFRAYHNSLHEDEINVIVAEFDENKEISTFSTEDGLTLVTLTAYRNKPSKTGGES